MPNDPRGRPLATHFFWWLEAPWFFRLWKRLLCPRGYHLLDEVRSSLDYFSCDACHLCLWLANPEPCDWCMEAGMYDPTDPRFLNNIIDTATGTPARICDGCLESSEP